MKIITALAFAGAFSFQASAQDILTGRGLVCDTKDQVQHFVKEMQSGNDANTSLSSVNSAHPKSCSVLVIAYREDKEHDAVQIGGKTYIVIEFTVIGINHGNGWIQVAPGKQYGLKATMDRGA